MNHLPTNPSSYKNRVLACLPKSEIKRLEPLLEPAILNVNDTLLEAGEKVQAAYFLEQGLCSLVVEMKGGTTVEVGLIGKEGVVGAAAMIGAEDDVAKRLKAKLEAGLNVANAAP